MAYSDVVLDAVGKKITDKMLKEIDLAELEKELMPKFKQRLLKELEEAFEIAMDGDFAYELSEKLWEKGFFNKIMDDMTSKAVASLGPTPKKKVTKKRTK